MLCLLWCWEAQHSLHVVSQDVECRYILRSGCERRGTLKAQIAEDLCLVAGLVCLVTGCGFCASDYCEVHGYVSPNAKVT